MLRDGPLLFDAVDRDAYVPRPAVEKALLDAMPHSRGVLLVGPSGAGRSTMLNWLGRALDDEGTPVAHVDARVAGDLPVALDLVEQAFRRTGQGPTLIPLPSDLNGVVAAQERLRRLRAWPPTVVLIDNLADREVIRTMFGGFRDLLWETGHRWVVSAHPHDRARFLTPPADSFFADRIRIPPLTKAEVVAFVQQHDEPVELELDDEALYPGALVRALLHSRIGDLAISGAREELGDQTAAVLDHVVAMNRAVAADDDELVRRAGITPTSLRRHLGRLREAGYLTRVDENGGRPGRPRTLYLPASQNEAVWE